MSLHLADPPECPKVQASPALPPITERLVIDRLGCEQESRKEVMARLSRLASMMSMPETLKEKQGYIHRLRRQA